MSALISSVDLEGLREYLLDRPEVARRAARISINSVASRKAAPRFRKAVAAEVAFPTGYVNRDRLDVTKQATDADLTAKITARFRPTSLSRFAQGQGFEGARRTGGVRVRVRKGGSAVFMRGAFFVRLRRGMDIQDGFNVGLAIRLKPGERLRGRKKGGASVQLAPDLYLLYGPSVDQVFRDIAVAESPGVARDLEREFIRQWVRLNTSG
jgi:hypothetical protein